MHASLEQTDVLIVDCQTTGATPEQGHLLELGWAQVKARDVIEPEAASARLIALPEGAEIPRQVSRITGITRKHMTDASPPAAAWRELEADARALARSTNERQALTIIHYARFEMRFLSWLQATCDGDEVFPLDVVCTHEIARKLLPELPRRGLRALAGYFGASPTKLRRSASHVAATSVIWHHLLPLLAERGVRTVAELRAFLERPTPRRNGKRRHRYPMARELRLALPDRPGVYHMLRGNGDLLYVGKATSLARRVNSYFQKQSKIADRTLEMLTQARDLRVHPTETPLEAALLENEHIKHLAPPYNVALQEREHPLCYASVGLDSVSLQRDRHHRIGPLSDPRAILTLNGIRALLDGRVVGADTAVDESLFHEPESIDRDVLCVGVEQFRDQYLLGARGERLLPALLALGHDMWRERLLAIERTEAGVEDDAMIEDAGQSDSVEGVEDASVEGDASPGEGEQGSAEEPRWTADALTLHLARTTRRAVHAIRRARWLVRLGDSSIAWSPAGQRRQHRLLSLRGGAIVECTDLARGCVPPVPAAASRPGCYDGVTYDRLRILTTELRRMVKDCDYLVVRFARNQLLERDALARSLRWV